MKSWISVSWEVINKNLSGIAVSSVVTNPFFILLSFFTALSIPSYLIYNIYKRVYEYYSTGNEDFYIPFDIKLFFLEGIKIFLVRLIALLPIIVPWVVSDFLIDLFLNMFISDAMVYLILSGLYFLFVWLPLFWAYVSIYYFSIIAFDLCGFDISKVFRFSYQIFVQNISVSFLVFLIYFICFLLFLVPFFIVCCFTMSLLSMFLWYVTDIIIMCYLASLKSNLNLNLGGE
ncbi:MAG: hypothetical protein N2169_00510 [bacterium]|nr:hypothetical protein [bacterium]